VEALHLDNVSRSWSAAAGGVGDNAHEVMSTRGESKKRYYNLLLALDNPLVTLLLALQSFMYVPPVSCRNPPVTHLQKQYVTLAMDN
jgi:hypothetical protein